MRGKVHMMKVMSLAALVAGSAAVASAQSFSLDTNVNGRPGDTVELRLFVTSPQPVAALNFTVSIGEDNNDENLVNGNITGVKASTAAIAGFTYVDNSLTQASSKEYRGVLYAPTGATTPFSAGQPVHVATVRVPLAAGASDGTQIVVKLRDTFGTDGVTGLLGISDANGVSLVPGGNPATARPSKTDGSLIIDPTNTSVDFTGTDQIRPNWEFLHVFPAFGNVLPTPAQGLDLNTLSLRPTGVDNTFGIVIDQQALGGFGLVQTVDTPAAFLTTGPVGSVVHYTWTLNSTGTSGSDFPATRLRVNAADNSYAAISVYQEPFAAEPAPVLVPKGGNARTLRSVVYVDETVNNNTNVGGTIYNGLRPALDFINVGSEGSLGRTGADIHVMNFNARSIAASQFTNPTQVASLDFEADGAQGFTVLNSVLDKDGLYTTSSDTNGGLSLTMNSNSFEPFAPGIFYLSYGFWEGVVPGMQIQANKIYKVDFTLATDATDLTKTPTTRLRFTAGENDFVSIYALESTSFDQALYIPNGDGKTYTTYVLFPDELAGNTVRAAFDVYSSLESGEQGKIILRDLTITSYDMPASF